MRTKIIAVAAIALMGAMAFAAFGPALAGAPVRFQQRDGWGLWRCVGGPLVFQDVDRNGAIGLGDRVFMIRGHIFAHNVAFLGGASVDQIDFDRPAQTHLAGSQKRVTILGIDPATGMMTIDQQAQRIRNVYSDASNLLGLGCRINYFTQGIIWTGQVHKGIFFVVQPIATIHQSFPGQGIGSVNVHRPCAPSPNQDNACNPLP